MENYSQNCEKNQRWLCKNMRNHDRRQDAVTHRQLDNQDQCNISQGCNPRVSVDSRYARLGSVSHRKLSDTTSERDICNEIIYDIP
jgi:hypothetical protein